MRLCEPIILSMSAGCPKIWTGIIAFVFFVISLSTAEGRYSRYRVRCRQNRQSSDIHYRFHRRKKGKGSRNDLVSRTDSKREPQGGGHPSRTQPYRLLHPVICLTLSSSSAPSCPEHTANFRALRSLPKVFHPLFEVLLFKIEHRYHKMSPVSADLNLRRLSFFFFITGIISPIFMAIFRAFLPSNAETSAYAPDYAIDEVLSLPSGFMLHNRNRLVCYFTILVEKRFISML